MCVTPLSALATFVLIVSVQRFRCDECLQRLLLNIHLHVISCDWQTARIRMIQIDAREQRSAGAYHASVSLFRSKGANREGDVQIEIASSALVTTVEALHVILHFSCNI